MTTAPDVPFPRPLYPSSHSNGPVPNGNDILAVKRAISRAGYFPWASFDTVYSEKFAMEGVKKFQQANGLMATGNYGEPTHQKLCEVHRAGSFTEWAFDDMSIRMMEQYDKKMNEAPDNLAKIKVRNLLNFCKMFTGPYNYGAEHDGSFADDDFHDAFDCSSSTSFALYEFNLLGDDHSHVSGWFENWGQSGRGKYITVHAAEDHVWMEINIDGRYYRFDTSPHGDGPTGPRVRTRARSDSRFVHRHPINL